ncbi:NAD(P)H-binding protein [Dactylosporangium darangshiense]|uniref:NAD(P)H-binding protein n=1 Tax=Dactylosporangium darangshiense TaxID=579108 RepID=A0ABP8DJ85_9ACTN
MILVTGATGTIGRHLVATLNAEGAAVRAISRTAGAVDGVSVHPDVEGVLRSAAPGEIDALFLHPRVAGERAPEILALAAERGVRRAVVLSAMNVDDPLEEQPSRLAGDRNRELDRAAAASGLEWASLRASSFASNTIRAFAPQLRFGEVVRYPFRGFEESLIDERDVAEVAARALLGEADGILELTGPQSLTHGEQVATLAAVLSRPLRFEEVPPEAAAAQMTQRGMPAAFVEALMARYRRHLAGPQHPPTTVVEEILKRPARPFARFVAEHRERF